MIQLNKIWGPRAAFILGVILILLILLCGISKVILLHKNVPSVDLEDDKIVFYNNKTSVLVTRNEICEHALPLFANLMLTNTRLYSATFSLLAHYKKAYHCYFHALQYPVFPIDCEEAYNIFQRLCKVAP